jgi:hypothetical protein
MNNGGYLEFEEYSWEKKYRNAGGSSVKGPQGTVYAVR